MKRFLSIIFILVLSFFGFVACVTPEDGELTGEQLASAKTDAISQLEAYVGALKEADYAATDWNSIQSKLVEAKAAINQCTNEDDMAALVSSAKTFIDGVKKLTGLPKTKAAAVAELVALVGQLNEEDYAAAEWTTIQGLLEAAKTAIEACEAEAAVATVLSEATTAINSVQKTGSIDYVKANAIIELEAYVAALNQADYTSADWAIIQSKVNSTKTAINASGKSNIIASLLTNFKNEVEAIEKIDPVVEKKAEKLAAIEVLRATYVEEDYTETTWAKIQQLFDEIPGKIEEATTIAAVNKAYNDFEDELFTCLTKDEENEKLRTDAIIKGSAELEAEFAKYNEEEYDANAFIEIRNIKDTAAFIIGDEEELTVAEIEAIVAKAIEDMKAVKKLIYITYNNIEDCTWVYSSIQAIRDELLKDYNTVLEKDYTAESLPFGSWECNDFHTMFYAEVDGVKMNEKWAWIANYFATVGGTSNKGPCGKLNNYTTADAFHNDNVQVNVYAVSYEFRAFIKGTKFTANANFNSVDYSLDEINNRVWEFLGAATTYVHGTTYVLPEPAKKYQDFLGWYDNPEFTGEPITQITEAESNIVLYAKWSELTAEGELELYKEAKVNELKAYLESSKDSSKYNNATWETVLTTLEEQVAVINTQTDTAGVDTALEAAKAALDAILPTNYTVEYVLDGGHWGYASKEELAEAFFADFSAHSKVDVTAKNFFAQSFGHAYLFFTAYPEWAWLPGYLATINTEKADKIVINDEGMAQTRIEIQGYFTNTIAANDTGAFESYDYSSYANDLGFTEYLQQTTFEYVEEVTLQIPLKDGYKFIGWYSNAEFTGDAVTTVSEACTLYAKFELLTNDDILNSQKEAAKAELNEYVAANKDYSKFTEADKVLFEAKVAELVGTIEAAATIEAVDAALVDAKAAVDAYAYSTYEVEFVLDGGHWLYENKAAMAQAFIADFNTLRSSTTIENFFSTSWEPNSVILRFFKQYTNWQWLIDYLATTCAADKATYFTLDAADPQLPYIRAEIEGYFNNKQYKHASIAAYVSTDYTGNENDLGFTEYLKQAKLEFLGETAVPVAYKDGYVLAGWYDNAEFTGDAVTTLTGATKLYAKWEVKVAE